MKPAKIILKRCCSIFLPPMGKMKNTIIGIILGSLCIFLLAGCPPPSEPNGEDYPGGGGYFPDGLSNFIHYQCIEDNYGSDINYVESDEIGEYHDFYGVTCKDWFFYNYNADFNYYHILKIVDEGGQGLLLCYGWEKRDLNHQIASSEKYPEPAVILDYPLFVDKSWDECDFQNISPENFNLNKDVDGDGANDTIDLIITHNVKSLSAIELPTIGTFADCYEIEDNYTLHIDYSDPTFPYPADYQFIGTSYYRPFIGWVKSTLTTNMFSEERTITREMYDYYVGGPTKQ